MANSIGGYVKDEEPAIDSSGLARGAVRVKQEAMDTNGGSLGLDPSLSMKMKAETSDYEDGCQHYEEKSLLRKAKVKVETSDSKDSYQHVDVKNSLLKTPKIKTETSESEDDCQVEGDGDARVKKEDIDDEDSIIELPSSPANLAAMNQHQVGRIKHTCDDSVMFFHTEKTLRLHLKLLHGPDACRCAVCGRRFSKEATMLKHKRTHFKWTRPGFKSFERGMSACLECDRWFSSQKLLNRHKRLVHALRCFKCCKKFVREAPLIEHLRIHSQERPYACVCLAAFQTFRSLRKHAHKCTRAWKQDKCCLCNLCGQRFRTPSSLKAHLLDVCSPMPPVQ